MSAGTIEEKLLQWVNERNPGIQDIDVDTDLMASGYVDSMGFVGLMVLLEELGGRHLDDVLANPEDFRTIRHITQKCFT